MEIIARQSKSSSEIWKTKTNSDSGRTYLRATQDVSSSQIHKIFKYIRIRPLQVRVPASWPSHGTLFLSAIFKTLFPLVICAETALSHSRNQYTTVSFFLSENEWLEFSCLFQLFFFLLRLDADGANFASRRSNGERTITDTLHRYTHSYINYWQCDGNGYQQQQQQQRERLLRSTEDDTEDSVSVKLAFVLAHKWSVNKAHVFLHEKLKTETSSASRRVFIECRVNKLLFLNAFYLQPVSLWRHIVASTSMNGAVVSVAVFFLSFLSSEMAPHQHRCVPSIFPFCSCHCASYGLLSNTFNYNAKILCVDKWIFMKIWYTRCIISLLLSIAYHQPNIICLICIEFCVTWDTETARANTISNNARKFNLLIYFR